MYQILQEKTEVNILKQIKPFHGKLDQILQFKPKIRFLLSKAGFTVKTAENPYEFQEVLKLRHRVFYEELLHKNQENGLDMDEFDFICDHLIVIDEKENRIIGTYRLNSSLFTDYFYSETEFDIKNLKKLPGTKLELGRACIEADYRNGLTITLLWAGLSEYIKKINARYLFGCSSVKTVDTFQIGTVFQFLKERYYSDVSLRVYPIGKFKIGNISSYADFISNVTRSYDPKTAKKLVPSLLNSYLKAGAFICGEPALDKDFQCIDFLTLLDTSSMKETVIKKFDLGS
ncbi:MAG TPA: GNAT family N-acetyltransferase [Spirochaetia bacterium]|nr:GNAT family N-acetyltransferase [Spirochaetia bacterium]